MAQVFSRDHTQMHPIYKTAKKCIFAESCYHLHSINTFLVDKQAKGRAWHNYCTIAQNIKPAKFILLIQGNSSPQLPLKSNLLNF